MTTVTLQYAALPFKIIDGQMSVLLVTSRETKRWILPKGRPEKKQRACCVAAQEAYEEAGVAGNVSLKSIGGFASSKRLNSGEIIPTWVRVYLLEVTQELEDWPESHERQRKWVPLDQASIATDEPILAEFLTAFALTQQKV